MNTWTRKYYLQMEAPTEEDNRPTQRRIKDALRSAGLTKKLVMDRNAVLHAGSICRDSEWKVTATLVYDGYVWHLIDLETGDTTACHYGLAVDMGSTTIVMDVYDMNTGKRVARKTTFNPQIAYGEDILNRIFYTREAEGNLEKLQRETAEGFNRLIHDLSEETGINIGKCGFMVVSGNTCMTHFFLGYDPFYVFSTPYAVETLAPGTVKAKDINIDLAGYVYCYPGKANYLGGDIISGMIATDIPNKNEISVFLDIGTNGELVIGNREFMLCGAGAAGPALEGGSVTSGMRADKGAVDKVHIENDRVLLHTLGSSTEECADLFDAEQADCGIVPPKGICGSGIVDLIAEMYLCGIVDIRGKFVPDSSAHLKLVKHPAYDEDMNEMVYAFEYAPGLLFYEFDVEELVKTKAAAMTMVEYMMQLVGLSMEDIGSFYISGAFGTHLSKESAITIGMYPDIDRERLIQPGNTSLDGAAIMLMDKSKADQVKSIIDKMEYVQFGAVEDFLHLMVAARAIPHTDLTRYPSVLAEAERRRSAGK